ncbi:MAG: YdeI/OmpD-associated family protein [Flavobacteriales bacterium]|jgi:hypothetical protein|nr:YdeI/OmpD-associated family protein [Flavobacteriales bacterium]
MSQAQKPVRFKTEIKTAGKTATGIEIPSEVISKLGTSKKPAVQVTLKGYTYRSTVAVMGGKFMVSVSADVRENAGVVGGETVDVQIQLDTAPREVELPPELAALLKKDGMAKANFDKLSYSKKKVHALAISTAKTPETLVKRIAKVKAELNTTKKDK